MQDRSPMRARTGAGVAMEEPGRAPRTLSVLGATGSVGTSTLDLVAHHPGRFEIMALTAQSNVGALAELAIAHRARLAVIGDEACYGELKERLRPHGITAAAGAGRGGVHGRRLRHGRHRRRSGP